MHIFSKRKGFLITRTTKLSKTSQVNLKVSRKLTLNGGKDEKLVELSEQTYLEKKGTYLLT